MAYNFNIKLHPWGNSQEFGTVVVDESAMYGGWDYKDGSEGGGLWFEKTSKGKLNLTDFDGSYALPKKVIEALRLAGFSVDADFE